MPGSLGVPGNWEGESDGNNAHEVFKLVRRLNLSGGKVFDCVLAVTAKENGVEEIYTENVGDFEFYDFLKVSNPLI